MSRIDFGILKSKAGPTESGPGNSANTFPHPKSKKIQIIETYQWGWDHFHFLINVSQLIRPNEAVGI